MKKKKKAKFLGKLDSIVRDECRKPITSRDNINEYQEFFNSKREMDINLGFIYDPNDPLNDEFSWVNEFVLEFGIVPTFNSLAELRCKNDDYYTYVNDKAKEYEERAKKYEKFAKDVEKEVAKGKKRLNK